MGDTVGDDLLETIATGHQSESNKWLYDIEGLRKGRINIVIAANGDWLHDDEPIRRQELVKLLEDSLLFVDGEVVLRAPEQLLRIGVEDQPFLITHISREYFARHNNQQRIRMENARGLSVVLDKDHPLELRLLPNQELKTPVVHIRDGLWARLNRNCYYQLLELATQSSDDELEVVSCGCHFKLSA